ncbi:ClpP/crotonase [Ascobolus immersus RN42]|uniref:ClpP/crotonase n=1 Tax=Ascobolus immersus RN42 TaxID=1160509 RepID=A0A3N4HGM0_ASCIM|nr:ClpP/crotonase [Ascobolus immersus RN42]
MRPTLRLWSLASTATSTVKFHSIPAPHTGAIGILTLAAPYKNALSLSIVSDLHATLSTLKFWTSGAYPTDPSSTLRTLIINSDDPSAFCAGANLKERITFTDDQTAAFLKDLRGVVDRIDNLPIPTIAVIEGAALGGGCELALATTLRLASPSALLGLPETRLGIIPGAGGTLRLKRLLGESRALDLILTGRKLKAEEAEKIGLVNRVVPEGESALSAAIEVAKEICRGGPVATVEAIRAVREEDEPGAYERVRRTPDRDEGLAAFKEKRGMKFSGKIARD